MPNDQEKIRQITHHLSDLSQQYQDPEVFVAQMDDYLAKLKAAGELEGLDFEGMFSIYWGATIFLHSPEILL